MFVPGENYEKLVFDFKLLHYILFFSPRTTQDFSSEVQEIACRTEDISSELRD